MLACFVLNAKKYLSDYLQVETAKTCYQRVQVLMSQGCLKLAQKLTKSATNYGLRRGLATPKDKPVFRHLMYLQMDITLRLKQTSELEVLVSQAHSMSSPFRPS